MDDETRKLYSTALYARTLLAHGATSYEAAFDAAKKYADHANKRMKAVAKRFGIRPKLIDPRGFLR